jgi:GTPase SAR1 family protein
VTNAESFSCVRRWIDEINRYCQDNIAKVLIGNKDDINPIGKVISSQDAKQYAQQMNLSFFETSARDNKNVTEAFYAVTQLALKQRLESRKRSQSLDLTNGRTLHEPIRLKRSKKKDKKHNSTCCK